MMGWQWHQLDNTQIICTSLQTANQAGTLTLFFLQSGCSSRRPTRSVKVLKLSTTCASCHQKGHADNKTLLQQIFQLLTGGVG